MKSRFEIEFMEAIQRQNTMLEILTENSNGLLNLEMERAEREKKSLKISEAVLELKKQKYERRY